MSNGIASGLCRFRYVWKICWLICGNVQMAILMQNSLYFEHTVILKARSITRGRNDVATCKLCLFRQIFLEYIQNFPQNATRFNFIPEEGGVLLLNNTCLLESI